MSTENYSSDYTRIELVDQFCRENNKSDAFKPGALDGIDGNLCRRKKPPANDLVLVVEDNFIKVSGWKTYVLKDHLKAYRGRWDKHDRCWILPESKIDDIKADPILGSELAQSRTKEYLIWIADYNAGKEWFNLHGDEILRSSPKR